MATKIKPDSVTPAVAAQQAEWHCRQAAEHFADSNHPRESAPKRQTARKRFLADARHALPTMGLQTFLATFKQHLFQRGHVSHYDDAEPIITALAGEPAPVQPVLKAEPVAVPVGALDTLKTAHAYLISALSQLAFGIERISDADSEAGAVETR